MTDATGEPERPPGPGADASAAVTLRSNWHELGMMLPDVGRLLRALAVDPRVPWRAKLVAGVAAGYAFVPRDRRPDVLPGSRIGIDEVLVLTLAVRHLIAAAGYEVVRERWTGTDGGFAMLVVLAGVDR